MYVRAMQTELEVTVENVAILKGGRFRVIYRLSHYAASARNSHETE